MEDILCNNIKVLRFINTPVPSNTFLLVDESGKHCVVIDPGSKEQTELRDYITSKGLFLDYIILTHEHFDHCWGVNYLLESFTAKVVATRLCAEWIGIPMNYFNKLYFDSDEMYSIKTVDLIAEEIDWTISWQGIDIHLIDAKGHTNRSMCLSVANALFSGDTMIYNTKPFLKKKYGASLDDLAKTLKKIYANFDGKTMVFPGHGDSFRLFEMQAFYNRFFQEKGICVHNESHL